MFYCLSFEQAVTKSIRPRVVKRELAYSTIFPIHVAVRQGGVLSLRVLRACLAGRACDGQCVADAAGYGFDGFDGDGGFSRMQDLFLCVFFARLFATRMSL